MTQPHDHAHDHDAEPFGQRGVLPYVWPVFVVLCAVGLCTCLLMNHRSWSNWDIISNASANRQMTFASVIGRIVIDVYPTGRGGDMTGSIWSFDTDLFDNIQDGWQPSWKKTLGVEWGEETVRRFGGQQVTYWRLRIRWRTLAVLYAVPVVVELSRRFRQRFGRAELRGELNTTAA